MDLTRRKQQKVGESDPQGLVIIFKKLVPTKALKIVDIYTYNTIKKRGNVTENGDEGVSGMGGGGFWRFSKKS